MILAIRRMYMVKCFGGYINGMKLSNPNSIILTAPIANYIGRLLCKQGVTGSIPVGPGTFRVGNFLDLTAVSLANPRFYGCAVKLK